MEYTLDEQLAVVQSQADKLNIMDITSTDKVILIKANIQYPVYFAFYGHYIVCSGDYGEWIFDCTWDTIKNGLPVLTDNVSYLLDKLSSDCKEYTFDYDKAMYDVDYWLTNFYDSFDEDDIDEDKKVMIEEAVEILKSDVDENRVAVAVDNFRDTMEKLDVDMSDDYELYDAGNMYNRQLLVNLACLKKLNEMNKAGGLKL